MSGVRDRDRVLHGHPPLTLTPNFIPSAALAVALEHLARPGEGKWPLGQPLD